MLETHCTPRIWEPPPLGLSCDNEQPKEAHCPRHHLTTKAKQAKLRTGNFPGVTSSSTVIITENAAWQGQAFGKAQPGMSTSHPGDPKSPILLQFQLPAAVHAGDSRGQLKGLGSYSPGQATRAEFSAPALGLTQPWLLWAPGKWAIGEISVCISPSGFQIKGKNQAIS